MKQLPDNTKLYNRTPIFTETSIPQGLLKNHNTKQGVWGKINIIKGQLEYIIMDNYSYVLEPNKHGIIEPETLHHIKPLGEVSFFIEFYKSIS